MVIRRPLRPIKPEHIEVTPEGERAVLPVEPIEYIVTERGQGEFLPDKGAFRKGEDARRHRFTELECRLGGHVAAFSLLCHYGDAYALDDAEWEQLAAERMNRILSLRAAMYAGNGLYA